MGIKLTNIQHSIGSHLECFGKIIYIYNFFLTVIYTDCSYLYFVLKEINLFFKRPVQPQKGVGYNVPDNFKSDIKRKFNKTRERPTHLHTKEK